MHPLAEANLLIGLYQKLIKLDAPKHIDTIAI